MEDQKRRMLKLLQGNKGFDTPERWLDYGINHNFQEMEAETLTYCPDCGSRVFSCIGQYVYYSTLARLNECPQCGLVFSDARIDPQVISSHFENTYKDEDYFRDRRRRVFDQIATLVDRCAPHGGTVLDVGGAKGHLLATVKKRRPDLKLVVNDLSRVACAFATSEFELDSVCGDIRALELIPSRFNTVIMSDVLYYEPYLSRLWKLLPRLVSDGGSVIIRVPNKLPLIRFCQLVMRSTTSREKRDLQDHIKYFNPEHIYVLSPRYLLSRLRDIAFSPTIIIPSELLVRTQGECKEALYFRFAKALAILSHGRLIITPSFLVMARNNIGEGTTESRRTKS